MSILGKVKDRPSLTVAAAALLVAVHWVLLLAVGDPVPDPAAALAADPAAALAIYLGFAGVVSIVAGFAGVVVTFALGHQGSAFLRLRRFGGAALRANWVSPIATSFSAAFGVFWCAAFIAMGWSNAAWWLFEFLYLVAGAAAARLMWLFIGLADIVARQDVAALVELEREREVDVFDPDR